MDKAHLLFKTFIFICLFSSQVSASLLISPTRIVFDDRDRATTVTVINQSEVTKTYRFGMIDYMQTETGDYLKPDDENFDTSAIFSATDMLRISPRQATLAPGERQRIRVSVRRPDRLAQGEYRSHLSFTELPAPTKIENNPAEARIQLFMLTSFTIPIQLRQGAVNVNADISNLMIDTESNALNVTISRQGDFGIFGNLTLLWQSSESDPFVEVGRLNNATLYRELNTRTFNVHLPKDKQKKGIYKVIYRAGPDLQNRLFDEKYLRF